MSDDIHEIFEELTGCELTGLLEEIDQYRLYDLAMLALKSTSGEPENENEFLHNTQNMIEQAINCKACIIMYDESEFHIMGQLPENAELKIKGQNDKMDSDI